MARPLGLRALHCIFSLLIAATLLATALAGGKRDYGIAFDAGSSGTRVYVYSWRHRSADKDNHAPFSVPRTRADWSKKSSKPLASFAEDPTAVREVLKDLIGFAKGAIERASPGHNMKTVPVFLGATAGMRIIPEQARRDIIYHTRQYFHQTGLHFVDAFAKILSGEEEALFGWISVNFMKGTLRPPAGQEDDDDLTSRRALASPELTAAGADAARARAHAIVSEVAESALPLETVLAAKAANTATAASPESNDEDNESLLSVLAPLANPSAASSAALTAHVAASAAYAAVAHFFTAPAPAAAAAGEPVARDSLRARAFRALSVAASAAAAASLPATTASASAAGAGARSFESLAVADAQARAQNGGDMWGAMDLGGASTQITFTPPSDPLANHVEFIEPNSGVRHDLYAISHLGFGINEAVAQTLAAIIAAAPADATTVYCPCFNRGFSTVVKRESDGSEVTLSGTGDYDTCEEYIIKILRLDSKCFYDKCSVSGSYMPPLPTRARFVAFSAFPSITQEAGLAPGYASPAELAALGRAICLRQWAETEGKLRNTACLATAYVSNLLEKAYGIGKDDKVVSFELDIDNQEVTWAGGFALYQVNLLDFEGLIKAVVALLIVIGVLAIALLVTLGIIGCLLYQRRRMTRSQTAAIVFDKPIATNAYYLQPDLGHSGRMYPPQ